MVKKIVTVALSLALIFSIAGSSSTFAASESASDKIGNINNQIKEKRDKIEKNEKKEEKLESKIETLEASISKTEAKLDSLHSKIDKTNEKIKNVKDKIKKLKEDIKEQEYNLNSRLRSMYKNGNMGVIQVLLGSENVQDFMANFKMIKELHKSDVTILTELEDKYAELETKKEELDTLASELKVHEESQVETQKQLEADKKEISQVKAKLEAENEVLYEDIDKLEAESSRLTSEISNLTNSNKKYKGSGVFQWPFPSYVRTSSEYGWRIHPISGKKKFHSGIDLAGPSGSPIVAAEDGTVISAGWNSGGYGNMVIIDHGSNIATVYAHNSSLSVSTGQQVKRGQEVAKCGSTGFSTGPHLHFEVRKNGSTVEPRAYIGS